MAVPRPSPFHFPPTQVVDGRAQYNLLVAVRSVVHALSAILPPFLPPYTLLLFHPQVSSACATPAYGWMVREVNFN